MKNYAIKGTSIIAAGLVCAAVIASGLSVIETGERGVVLCLGRYAGTMDEGLNFKIPMVDRVVKLTVRDTKYTAKLEVSSSDIRRRIAEGEDITGLVPAAVADYIREKGLYKQ